MCHLNAVLSATVIGSILAGCALGHRSDPEIVGIYRAQDDKSSIELVGDGTYTVEERNGEVNIWFAVLGGRWNSARDQVTLSWEDGSAEHPAVRRVVYTVIRKYGKVVLQLSAGQHLPTTLLGRPMGISLDERYRRMVPNQAANRMPGSKAAGDSGRH